MSFNQPCQKLYSDKVSKVVIFGPISNFARSFQAAPPKLKETQCDVFENYHESLYVGVLDSAITNPICWLYEGPFWSKLHN